MGERGESRGVVVVQQGAHALDKLQAVPDRVLLGAGQHGDRLGEMAVVGDAPVGVHVGAQDVRQGHGITVVGHLAGRAVARDNATPRMG
ncbi:hypothetical protein BG844_01960 [Couchioplanes caeruleus subsp. caeruleus]|uniref:Uncharacterized protein n=1 Tax=Couchioplanes caeruleus subsp. caeruleus TaxID=56427 RepID=A0A1K0GFI0_9ACTN|nr:hypothetical protein BG844_01960 [Couchioplanes caeruleus subsp. caeruleus]